MSGQLVREFLHEQVPTFFDHSRVNVAKAMDFAENVFKRMYKSGSKAIQEAYEFKKLDKTNVH